MVSEGTYEEVRALCNELSRGLGSVAFFTVVAFCIYSWIAGGITLGWLWIPYIPLAIVLATIAVGIPVIVFRMKMEFTRPTIGFGWFFVLKLAATAWVFASFLIAWRVAAAVAGFLQ